MKKYDDMKWHLNDEFPKDLPPEASAIHMGMFLGWAIDRHFEGDLLKREFAGELVQFRQRKLSAVAIIMKCCDGKLVDEDFAEGVQPFVKAYYEESYFDDYADTSTVSGESIFHESDSWDRFDEIKVLLDRRYDEWKRAMVK